MNKAIIWDLDGTLMDSLVDLHRATNHALEAFSLESRSIDEVRSFVGNGVGKLMERAVFRPYHTGRVNQGIDDELFQAIFAEFKRWYVQHCQDNTRPYDGILQVLDSLHREGVRMAIVSNKLQAGVSELHQHWFADVIDVAVGERAGIPRKPSRDMVDIAIAELCRLDGCDEGFDQVWYVGDSDVDVATAHNSQLPCIAVLWGFRSRQILAQAGATTFADTPSDIFKIVCG